MQDLTPVGLSKDGKRLILISASGEEFSVAVDPRLRTALRGDHARLGQLEMTMESTLRPRDIQARIRSGESAESVAAAANTEVDKIMGFAGPVLAERAHIAQAAQLASVRRKSAESSSAARTLNDAAATYFSDLGVRTDTVEWDAWRRDDGRWTVVAEFGVEGKTHTAEFTYDAPGRYVVADNPTARLLTGEAKPAASATNDAASRGRRLTSVPVDQDELPLGDDAIAMVRDQPEIADHADADWIASVPEETRADAGSEPQAESQAESEADTEDDAEVEAQSEAQSKTPTETKAEEPTTVQDDEPTIEVNTAKKKGRASVPSWDEIMFGGGKND